MDLEQLMAGTPTSSEEFLLRRRILGLTRTAVARELGISDVTLKRWEEIPQPHEMSRRSRWQAALEQAVIQRTIAAQRATVARRHSRNQRNNERKQAS